MRTKRFSFVWGAILLLGCTFQNLSAGWQIQKTHWPRLTYETADLAIIRDHLNQAQQGVEPYKTLWQRIQTRVASSPRFPIKDWGQQSANGSIAKAKALVFVLQGDIAQANQVRDVLQSLYVGEEIPTYGVTSLSLNLTPYKNLKASVMQSIFMAQSLTLHCQAYDMLKGAGYNFGTSEKVIKNNLAILAGRLYDISSWISGGAKTANLLVEDVEEQNNFQLKMMSALGMAAICLNDHPSAEKWINRAISKFWQVFTVQTTLQGGYGEGPFYFMYAGLNFLPFFRAYNLFMDGQGGTYEGYSISNFLTDERVGKVLDWDWRIRMPNGDRPGYDDGYYAAFPLGLLVSEPNFSNHATDHPQNIDPGVIVWDWSATEKMTGGYDNRYFSEFANADLTTDIFCVFDADVKPQVTFDSPTQFRPVSGNVIFRSGWEKDAIYLHLLAEKGNIREKGGVHEHPDAGSFVIYAFGELLALDAGYPGYPQHDLVNGAKKHNVLLVDGAGPTTDAEFTNFYNSPLLDFVSVKMNYGGADVIRNVVFLENRYFVLLDQLKASTPHAYTWLLHGYAGAGLPNSFFEKTKQGGIWKRPAARLETFVVTGRGNPTYEATEDYHSLVFYGKEPLPKHAVLTVSQTAGYLDFLSIIAPLSGEMKMPNARPLFSKNGAALRIETGINSISWAIVRGDSSHVRVQTDLPKVGEIVSDASVIFLQFAPRSDAPVMLIAKDVTQLSFGKKQFVSSKQPCQLALTFDAGKKEFLGQIEGTHFLNLALGGNVTGAKNSTYQAGTNSLQLEFDKPGSFRIAIEK